MNLKADDDGAKRVQVKMTLTAPGCGMGPTIQADAKSRIESLPDIQEANVELVWEPAWHQGMISEVGKMKLGLM
jgi:metal-sulfur cluster biosynthetic enzyme